MEAYGQTETCGPSTMSKSNSTHDASGNVGPPVPCNIVKLVDVPEMEYFAENSEGEVCVKGHNIFKGYLKDPIRTAEALDAEGWLHTGDIGMWLPNGTLKIIDRKKNILKLAQGEYVSPEKIESVYSMSPYVSQVLVHGNSLERFLVGIVIPEKQIVLSKLDESLKTKPWNEICQSSTVKQLILLDIQQKGKAAGLNAIEQNISSHLIVLQDYRRLKNQRKDLRLNNGLRKMILKFEEIGDLGVLFGRGQKPVETETVEEVSIAVVEIDSHLFFSKWSISVTRVGDSQERQCLQTTIFMQDGATAHIGRQIKALLSANFGNNCVVSRHFLDAWSSLSLDLNPHDFW
ncbi:long-chain-fatty-acid--CoA ligase 5 [Trichonephila clavipes]|nr:long-chain-fatty-acid--CoA ligase 5 [Trichonephila clavipes]